MKKKFNIKVYHADGTFSWLTAGNRLEFTKSKAEFIIDCMRKHDVFRNAVFEIKEAP